MEIGPGFRAVVVLVSCVLTTSGLARAQDSVSARQTEYLVTLGRLWATIKYFHPSIDESRPELWDNAALAAIPLALAAESTEQFVSAARAMVATLGDSVTRVERVAPPAPSAVPLGFVRAERRGRTLIVTSGPVPGDPLDSAAALAPALNDVDVLLFDLRAGAVHPWLFSLRMVSTTAIPFPAHRFRMHFGNVTPRGAEDTAYFSGLVTRSAPVPGVLGDRDLRAVFLVRDSSQVPLLAAALQAAGRAHIVAESAIDDRHIARHAMTRHHVLPLVDGWVAHVRTSEMLHADGTVGLRADAVVSGDGLKVALDAAEGRVPHAVRPVAAAGYRAKAPELPYRGDAYPAPALRVLAAFRVYGVFEWLYPYKHLIGREMTDVLEDALPRLLAARDARQYHLAVAEMVAHVGDTHATVDSQTLSAEWGNAMPPLALRPVEGRAVIVRLTDPIAEQAGASVGDVVDVVDGEEAGKRLAYLSRYISASNVGALKRDAVNRLLRGPHGSVARLVVTKADGTTREVQLERRASFMRPSLAAAADQTVKVLPQEIGYIDLRRLMPHEVDAAFATVAQTRGLIFDMRGYPNDTRYLVAERLTGGGRIHSGTVTFPVALEPGTRTETRLEIDAPSRASPRRYAGRTVMLIDDRAQSQSEATALLLKSSAGTVMIGSPTTGALGEGSNFTVPGGLSIGLTGTSVTFADGTAVQRVGVQPDVVATPTIAGIRAGRDEVLERAIEFLVLGR
jgi:C-terminal processing protease CtpA/Prc